jgi:hypothetical protein
MNTQRSSCPQFSETAQCLRADAACVPPPLPTPSPNNSHAPKDSWQHIVQVARAIEREGAQPRPFILVAPHIEANTVTATHISAAHCGKPVTRATNLPRPSQARPRLIRVTLLALVAWIAMMSLVAEAHAIGQSAPLRSLVQLHTNTLSGFNDYALEINNALVNDPAYVAQWLAAREAPHQSVRSTIMRGISTDAAKALTAVAGTPTLRFDAAGRVILRIGFMATPAVIAQYGVARLTADAKAAVVVVNGHFAQSGVGVLHASRSKLH